MNEDFVVKNQDVILAMCNTVCKHSHQAGDLAQWTSEWFLTHDVSHLNTTKALIYSVVWKAYNLRGSEFKREHNPSEFHYTELTVEDLELHMNLQESVDEQYRKVMDELNPIEKIWAEQIVKRNLSISLLSQHTGIGRKKATERMNEIYKKLRDNARD